MSAANEAADQVVSMSLKGVEVIAKLSGTGAKELALLLYSILKDGSQTRGKARLSTMLRSGKELKVFAVKEEDLKQFTKAAKEYGVLYCVLKNKQGKDGLCDIMVRAEDASKVNRIFERFALSTVDMATIRSEIQREQEQPQHEAESTQDTPDLQRDQHTQPGRDTAANPTPGEAERPHPSEPTSVPSDPPVGATSKDEGRVPTGRTSVKEELKSIKVEQLRQPKTPKLPTVEHIVPKGKKKAVVK